jgi:hypothetical protein
MHSSDRKVRRYQMDNQKPQIEGQTTNCQTKKVWFGFMRYATFNNISAISWRSVLLVEEIGVLGENHRPIASH